MASGISTERPQVFLERCKPKKRAQANGCAPGESPQKLKQLIGELTVQNDLLKNLAGSWAVSRNSTKWNWSAHYALLGVRSTKASAWITLYDELRLHVGLGNLSPEHYAQRRLER